MTSNVEVTALCVMILGFLVITGAGALVGRAIGSILQSMLDRDGR